MLTITWFAAASGMGAIIFCTKFKPHFFMVLVQVAFAFHFFFAKASFNHGMNPCIYTTYRHFVGGVFMLPFAYFLEKKIRPKLTIALFVEIFVLSLIWAGLATNMCFASIRYTSPTFVSCLTNTIASMTFLIAVMLRLESLDIRTTRGLAKIVGTLVSLAGLTTMTLYKGSAIKSIGGALIHIPKSNGAHQDWIKGSILTVLCCIFYSLWYIMQALTLKRYPAKLSLTTWMNFIGSAQSAVFSAFVAHKPKAWSIGFNIDLWSTLYSGIVVTGLTVFLMLSCAKAKGPVFVSMFNPLSTILVVVSAYFVLGQKLHVGNIVGGVVVIIGLYLLLWGKEADVVCSINSQKISTLSCNEEKEGRQGNKEANELVAMKMQQV